jgi:molybdopterin adenylyltransferase
MRAVVLTISDSSFAGNREDLSGPAVAEALRARGWEVAAVRVLPDEAAQIQRALQELAEDPGINAAFTTGGTGVAPRDVTPEATRRAIEREIPGLAELMRSEGLKRTRRAALARGLVGVRKSLLIVNLPGSPKGAIESLEAIADLLPHTVALIRGENPRHEHIEP